MQQWITKDGQRIWKVAGGRSNAYLVKKDNSYLLVDTGTKRHLGKLKINLEKLRVMPGQIACLIVTHVHYDHVQNMAALCKAYQVPVLVQRSEQDLLKRGKSPKIRGTIWFTRCIETLVNKGLEKIGCYDGQVTSQAFDKEFDLSIYGFNGKVIATPGHSEGSATVIINQEIALVGDTLFGVLRKSTFPPYALDKAKMMASWDVLLQSGCQSFLPGHGKCIPKESVIRSYNKHKE